MPNSKEKPQNINLIWTMFGFIHEPSKCFRTQSKEGKRETVALAQTVFCFFLKLESFFEMIVDTQEGKLKFEIRSAKTENRMHNVGETCSDIFECKTRLKKSKNRFIFGNLDAIILLFDNKKFQLKNCITFF